MGAAGTNLLGGDPAQGTLVLGDPLLGPTQYPCAEHFERFFADPDLQAFIGSVGAAPAPPELTIAEAVMSPDLF
jgi:hypothetical protein